MKSQNELFKNRFGLIASLIGMAVGTGNIWRFPRIMAQNGGGAFFIPWILFLFLWSIPLLLIEFSLGQKIRKGVTGCFAKLSNGKMTWMGGFVVFCTLGIMFYYSVVTGWCLYYFIQSMSGGLFSTEPKVFWDNFNQTPYTALIFHAIAIGLSVVVLIQGVQKGIEAFNRWMIPALFFILIVLAGYAMTLPGRSQGMEFIFNADFSKLSDYRVWLEALTQSAWSTGAGWGIALTYACYASDENHPTTTAFATGIGNNSVSLLAAFIIIPTLFSFFPLPEVVELTQSGNAGLTFIALPGLFQEISGGRLLATFFFLALFFAAFTSLFSMFELGVRFLEDLGVSRTQGVLSLAVIAFCVGVPSAINGKFLDNQDWVWGVGLLLSGFFFSLLIRSIGMKRFDQEFVPLPSGVHRFVFKILIFWLIPLEFLALIVWWFYRAGSSDPQGWWNPFASTSVGTCLAQWGILLFVLFLFNKRLSNHSLKGA